MSINDWYFVTRTGNITGSVREMSAMESITSGTIPNSGSFCRAWGDTQLYWNLDGQFTNNVQGRGLMTLSSSYDNSSLYGIPFSKAVSLRAYVRVANYKSTIGLGAKINRSTTADDMKSVSTGYRVYLEGLQTPPRGDNLGVAYLKAGWNTTSNTTLATFSNQLQIYNIDNGLYAAKRPWFHIRLDVIPVTASFISNGVVTNNVVSDIVNIYTGSLGPKETETWNLLSSRNIPNTSGEFTPWSATNAYGIIVDVATPDSPDSRDDGCIENFEIYTSSL